MELKTMGNVIQKIDCINLILVQLLQPLCSLSIQHAWLLVTLQVASDLRLQPFCQNSSDEEPFLVTSL